MGLTRYEQETTVNFNAEESKATIYTADPVWIRKLSNAMERNPEEFKVVERQYYEGKMISITYECPKKYISLRTSTPHYTEEQKAAMVERLRKGREK